MNNIHLEPLGGGLEIYVSESYRFSTDTILLANFSQPKGRKKCVDLGTGCGTIPLIWLRENKQLEIAAVDIQENACKLAQDSISRNDLIQMTVYNADLKELKGVLPFGYYDLVACNPPYKLGGSGIKNPESAKLIARHETECTLDDICGSASRLLQFGGRFCICQRPERLGVAPIAVRRKVLHLPAPRKVSRRDGSHAKVLDRAEGAAAGSAAQVKGSEALFNRGQKGRQPRVPERPANALHRGR